jgi:quercetin dioxygenase-like cupin family protein
MITVRRVVTGHDSHGRAMVTIDEAADDRVVFRTGANGINIWSTKGFPVDNDRSYDGGKDVTSTSIDDGSVFRVIEFEPGVAPRVHRTDSIDYAVVLSGEIDMELDETCVTLKAGDVLVQRGTIHNWVNKSNAPCVIAFVLIHAKPASMQGRSLHARG